MLRVYLSPCGRGYEGRVNVCEPMAEVGEGFNDLHAYRFVGTMFSTYLNTTTMIPVRIM